MDHIDGYLDPETLYALEPGEAPLPELLEHLLRHLEDRCPPCGENLRQTGARPEVGAAWLWSKVWEEAVRHLETKIAPGRLLAQRRAFREVAELEVLTWPERLGRVGRARTRFSCEETAFALIDRCRDCVEQAPREAERWAALALEVAWRAGHLGRPYEVAWALALAHRGNAQRAARRLEEAARTFTICRRFLRREVAGEPYVEAEIAALQAALLCALGRFEGAELLLRQAIRTYRRLGEPILAARCLVQLTQGPWPWTELPPPAPSGLADAPADSSA